MFQKIITYFKSTKNKKMIIIFSVFVIVILSLVAYKTYAKISKNIKNNNIPKNAPSPSILGPSVTANTDPTNPVVESSSPSESATPSASISSTSSAKNNDSPTSSPSSTSSSNSTPSPSPSSSSPSSSNSSPGLASCGSNYSFFDTSPLNESDYISLTPLGNLNPSGHVFPTDHIYFYLRRSGSGTANVPLYAPTNATITQINASEHVEDGFTDYSFIFQPCNEFKASFGHVTTLSSKINEALTQPYSWESTYSTGGKTYHNFGKMVSISISSGEQIGTVGGNPGQNALDMNSYDTRTTLNFANSSRWSQRDYPHAVCPISYFSGSLKDTIMNRFGASDSVKRTIEPICGTIEQDINGTAQGAWFLKGTTSWQNEDPHLALSHDNIDPRKPIFSVGTSIGASGLSAGAYEYSPQSSGLVNRDFSSISSDGNVYCFEPIYLPANKIILRMTSSTEIKIEKQSGMCEGGPWEFTNNFTQFER